MKRFFFITSFIGLAWQVTFSQSYQLRNYTSKDGLPGSVLYDILQDSQGYLWFVGEMGVSRFDGYEFKNYSTQHGLPNNSIINVERDSENRIWFISLSRALSYFHNGKIHTIPCSSELERTGHDRITSFYVDEGDTIWIGRIYSDPIKIAPPWKNENIQIIPLKAKDMYVYEVDKTGFIFGNKTIHVKDTLHLTVYNKRGKKYAYPVLHTVHTKSLSIDRINLRQLKDGTYLNSINDLLTKFDNKKIHWQRTHKNIILSIFEDNEKYYLGTYVGINVYDKKTNRETAQVLADISVSGICPDHENGLWFSTDGNGIFYLPYNNFRYYTSPKELPDSKITCAYKKEDQIMIGHLNASISYFNKGKMSNIRLNLIDRKTDVSLTVNSLLPDKNKGLLVGTYAALFSVDLEKQPIFSVHIHEACKKIIRSWDGNIWSVSYGRIKKFDSNLNVLHNIHVKRYTDYIFEDSKKTLWICSINGLWTYTASTGLVSMAGKNKLFTARIVEIQEDTEGNLWMATRGEGVFVKKHDTCITITEANGLAGNMCRTLFMDGDSIVWVGTNKGVSKINIAKNDAYKVTSYTSDNGLLNNEINHIIRLNNKLWLFHNNEISIVNPINFISNHKPPPIYITDIKINGKIYPKRAIGKLEHNQNYIEIKYTGISFKTAGKIRYKYKIEGLDARWNYTHYTSVKYQTLPPGKYRFIVYAQNNDGYWSTNPATLGFEIQLAWWQTGWFFTLAGLCLLLVIVVIFRVRLHKLRISEQEKALLRHGIELAELKALRAQMNPHFVFNVINSVQYFITSNDPDSSQKYLAKFGRLIRYVLDNSKPASITLEQELEALRLYLELEALRFENSFDFVIHIQPGINPAAIDIPSMLIQPYVENAICHGIMHKPGTGKISILLEIIENNLIFTVEDNGIGRQQSQTIKKADYNEHKSVGMSITRERLDIINQVNQSELSVVVIDLTNENGEASGTKVKLTIPLYQTV